MQFQMSVQGAEKRGFNERFAMDIALFSFLTFLGSMTAGFLGALTGLGAGLSLSRCLLWFLAWISAMQSELRLSR